MLSALSPLISDGHLHLAHLTVRLASSLLSKSQQLDAATADAIIERALLFLKSPLLQSTSLSDL